jgi:sugar/nucleoside kinase (ribokinase family)
MTADVAVVGAPFLDLTFAGLPRVPQVGEELVGSGLYVGPGGSGMQAIGAARLGLTTTLVAPIGNRDGAALVRATLDSEGVAVVPDATSILDPDNQSLPTTALLATPEGVAMATALGGAEPSAEDIAGAGARATVMSTGRLRLAPPDSKIFAVTGTIEIANPGDEIMMRLKSADVLILNRIEAMTLTRESSPEAAGLAMARFVPVVAVTLGHDGALVVEGDRVERAPAPEVEVADATGAGDLFVAAYVWADLRGASPPGCTEWATLYAGLSVRAPTALAGALHMNELLEEGIRRGLAAPPGVNR